MRSYSSVIKNDNVSYSKGGINVADNVRTKTLVDADLEKREEAPQEDTPVEIDMEAIKVQLRNEIFAEYEKEKQMIIEEAVRRGTEEAEELKRQAVDQGYKAGFEKGYEESIEACKDECSEIKRNAIALLQQAKENADEYYRENKENLINLAGDMAEAIVHTSIDTSSENILSMIKPIVQMYDKKENIIITVHPDSGEFLKSRIDELKAVCPNGRFIILEDGNLEVKGCTIENESQIIDLQIRKQIDSIIRDLNALEE